MNMPREKIRGLREILREICEANSQYEPLWANYINTVEDAGERTNLAPVSFPSYTRHDAKHSRTVLAKMEKLIGKDRMESLHATDIWLLLMCAHTHDLGMVVSLAEIKVHLENGKLREFYDQMKEGKYSEYKKAANELDFNKMKNQIENLMKRANRTDSNGGRKGVAADIRNAELINGLLIQKNIMLLLQSYFRKSHSLGYRRILTNNTNKSIHQHLFDLIASIDETHTEPWSAVMDLPLETDGIATDYAHPRFIAVMLRLSDLLDIDANRVNPYQLDLTISGNESMAHQERSLAVETTRTTPEYVGAHFHFKDDEIKKRYFEHGNGAGFVSIGDGNDTDVDLNTIRYNAARLAFDWYEMLKEELKNFALKWNDIVPPGYGGSAPQLKDEDFSVKINGDKMTTDDLDLRYELSNKRAYEIIQGAGIYSDELTFIRELLQNATDATKIQMYLDWVKHQNPDPSQSDSELTPERFIAELPYDINSKAIIITLEELLSNEDGSTNCVLKVEDYGTGISREKLKKLKYVGNIYDPETELAKRAMPEWLKPTGAFGIGLQSVFQITDRFDMHTLSTINNEALDIIFYFTEPVGVIFPQKALPGNQRTVGGTTVVVPLKDLQEKIKHKKTVNGSDFFTDKSEPLWRIIRKYIQSISGADIMPIVLRRIKANGDIQIERMESLFQIAFPEVFQAIHELRHLQISKTGYVSRADSLLPTFTIQRHIVKKDMESPKGEPAIFWYWSKQYNILAKISLDLYRKSSRGIPQIESIGDDIPVLEGRGDFSFRGITVGPSDPETIPQYSWEKLPTAWCDAHFFIQSGETDELLSITRDKLLKNGGKVEKMKRDAKIVLLDAFREILNCYAADKDFKEHVDSNEPLAYTLALAADCLIKRTMVLPDADYEQPFVDSVLGQTLSRIKAELLQRTRQYGELGIVSFYSKKNHVFLEGKKSVPRAESLENTEDIWFYEEAISYTNSNGALPDDIIAVYPDILKFYPIDLYWAEVTFCKRKIGIDGGKLSLLPICKYCIFPRRAITMGEEDKTLLMQQSYQCGLHYNELKLPEDERTMSKLRESIGERHTFPSFSDFEDLAVPYDASVCPDELRKCGYVIISPFTNSMFRRTNGMDSTMDALENAYRKSIKEEDDLKAFNDDVIHILKADVNAGADPYGFRALLKYVKKQLENSPNKKDEKEYLRLYINFIWFYLARCR